MSRQSTKSAPEDIFFRPAVDLLAMLRAGEIGCRELLDLHIARVERLNPGINAVVALDVERARKRADEADAALAKGEDWGKLHGLPMTIKDSFETAGLATTSGSPELAKHVPISDAVAVARLKAAGAIVFGKTNLPTYAADVQTYNQVFGVTNNPWDTSRCAGGSSGGAAAALAAGLTPLELGSDIGGSIRNPAHYCGVFGLKPSYGVVPMRGHIPGPPGSLSATDIAVAGPLARSVEDLELSLDILAGPDRWQAKGWRLDLPPPRHAAPAQTRVAAWLDDPACPIDGQVAAVLEAALEALIGSGIPVDRKARPGFEFLDATRIFQRLLVPIMAQAMSGETLARYARQTSARPPESEADSPTERFRRYAVSRHVDWLNADAERARLRAAWAAFFEDYDILLAPVMPTAAYPHDHQPDWSKRTVSINGKPFPYSEQIAWAGMIGVAMLPSVVVPVGLSASGLPVGMQIVGPYLEDRTALEFARAVAEATGGFRPPPGF
ncbi:MAG: amidase [Alphaproteobacteria bacterium]